MKRLIFLALALIPALALAQTPVNVSRATLASSWEMDGEAADADQVITAVAIIDDGSVTGLDYTIVAQPDICRLLDVTLVDTDLSAGTLTVIGTGCLGEAKSCAFAFTAGDDTGVQTLTCADGEGAYIAAVTDVTTGTMTGESDETFALGYTSNSVNGWPLHGTKYIGPMGESGVDPFGSTGVPLLVTTSGVASTTVTGVTAAADAFAPVDAGDIVIFTLKGIPYERLVVTNADDDTITINDPINIPAAGITYRLREFWYSSNPDHRMFVPVHGNRALLYVWSVDSNTNTGGVVTLTECTAQVAPDWPTADWVSIDTDTVVTTGTQVPTAVVVNLETHPYQYCRFGFKFGTGDDDDTGEEAINLVVSLMR